MRNALVKIFLIIALFSNKFIFGQEKILAVQMHPQETPKWCWAASMQMVFSFDNFSVAQSELASDFLVIRGGGKAPNDTGTGAVYDPIKCNCYLNCNECIPAPIGNLYKKCYTTIPVYIDASASNPDPQWFDLIFSVKDYNSIEEINRGNLSEEESWKLVKNQIDQCRPFILTISKSGEQDQITSHAVNVKGYYGNYSVIAADSLQFLVVNDPWDTCQGCERLIPNWAFARDTSANEIYAFVHDIYSKDAEKCILCDSTKFNISPLVETVKEHFGNFVGTTKARYSEAELDTIISQDPYQCYRTISYLSVKKLLKGSSTNLLMSYILSNEIRDVVYNNSNPPITTTLEKINDNWVVRGISICDSLDIDCEFSELINAYPLAYQFYRVIKGDDYYLTPVTNYPNFFAPSKSALTGEYYPEKEILKSIRKYMIEEYSTKKKCFINFKGLFSKKQDLKTSNKINSKN